MPTDERDPSDTGSPLSPSGGREGEAVVDSPRVFCRRCGETSVPVANCCPWCNAWLVGEPPKVAPVYKVDDEPEDDWHAGLREADFKPPVGPPSQTVPLLVVGVSYFALLGSLVVFAVIMVIRGVSDQEDLYGGMAVFGVLNGIMTLVALGIVWKSAKQVMPPRTRLLAWLAAFPMLAALVLVNVLFHTYLRELFKPFGAPEQQKMSVTLVTVLLICVQPAIVEELFFRQMMLGVFRRSMNVHVAVLLTALLFALAHLNHPVAMVIQTPYLFAAGVMFGYARVFGGLTLAMIMHFIHNFAVIAYAAWWVGAGG